MGSNAGECWGSRLSAKAGRTCGEVVDVLMGLGYRNAKRDFKECVYRFTLAVEHLKQKGRRPFPTWGEILHVAGNADGIGGLLDPSVLWPIVARNAKKMPQHR
ncbi:unnamed protein product [uncultured bacterium]|nr:unnamed protein product [uncultured bacterium]